MAQRVIDFLIDAKVAGAFRTIRYPAPDAVAAALMPPDYRGDRVVFPPPAAFARCQYSHSLGEDMARLYEYMITRVRTA